MVSKQSIADLRKSAESYVARLMREAGGVAALDSNASYAATDSTSVSFATYAELRADRWQQRQIVRQLLRGTRPAKCGRPVSNSAGIGFFWDKEYGSRLSGLQTCGSVWVCPVCNHKIQSSRFDDVKAVMEHCKAHAWGVVFGTLTVRHKRSDSLKDVIRMAQEVWRKSRSHRRIKDLFDRTHEVGYIRAMEITYSHANGWHVHFHCYYVFDHELTRGESADFAGTYAVEWVETAKRAGYSAPLAKNQKFEVIDLHKVSSIQAAAKYCTLSKTAVTPQTSKLGHELTNSQSKIGKIKVHGNGQKVLHLTYWDFIRILSDKSEQSEHTLSDNGYTLAQIEKLAKEYYKATKGCRALVWSRGLRDMCALGAELTDEELAAQEFVSDGAYRLTIWQWSAHVSRREYLIPLLFTVADFTHGDVAALQSFCFWFDIPCSVDTKHGWSKHKSKQDIPPRKHKNRGEMKQRRK